MRAEGLTSEMCTTHGTRFTSSQYLVRQLWRLQSSSVTTWRSPTRFCSHDSKQINASNDEIVNLH